MSEHTRHAAANYQDMAQAAAYMSQDLPWSTGPLVCRVPQERRALARAHQGCVWISSMLARLAGSATRMRVSRSLHSALTGMLFGKRKSTAKMRSRTWPQHYIGDSPRWYIQYSQNSK